MKLFATSAQQGLRIVVRQAGVIRFEEIGSLSPEQVFDRLIPINDLHEAEVVSTIPTDEKAKLEGRTGNNQAVPEAAKPALAPEEIKTNEELYLTGLHLEQYRHATYCPDRLLSGSTPPGQWR